MAEPIEPPITLSEEASAATEVFNSVKLNGELSNDNADILFLYGRSLFKVGQSKSDVLGGKSGGEKKKKKPKGIVEEKKAEEKEVKTESEEKEVKTESEEKDVKTESEEKEVRTESEKIAEEGAATIAEQEGSAAGAVVDAKKPLFQFTGDENFEDSDEDSEGSEAEAEDEDDLASAFEILDLARILFEGKLKAMALDENEPRDSPMKKHVDERLADVHDLLAEISLENENFPAAVTDFKTALQYKKALYPEESEIIAEAHFKLSLALEFSSITVAKGREGEEATKESDSALDQDLRDEAIKELELAIQSTKLKLANQEVKLAETSSPDDNEVTRTQIADVKEIVAEMESRLTELKGPAIDIKEALYGSASMAGVNPKGGILGATLGETPAEAIARIDEAKKSAKDLSGLVRKKTKPAEEEPTASSSAAAPASASTNGKRKAEDDEDVVESDSKKAKIEEVADAEPGA
ncbi:uncharacterized protein L3040_005606 [Drepanopeziza brunnea f. sp. 'multigermtubi']|uniref:uncharacterized protein n=1 Tax=Drepanopeziza brunnea f. sp. 'multigermtubi' TaxID=698441 RepID=UPI0023A217E1|nr:hypothetical protein L3040_005606 [Drepanopeziza brunnea f. sp. 'multigermtubi']